MIPLGVLAAAHVEAAGGAPGDRAFEYLTSASGPTSATTHTLPELPLGAASVDRTIIACVVTQTSITSVSIGGVSATSAAEDTAGMYGTRASVWYATVPAGATGDVVVTLGTAHDRLGVGLWRIGGAVSVASTATTSTATISLTTAVGDMVVACGYVTTGTLVDAKYKTAFAPSDSHAGASTTATGTTTSFTRSGTGFSVASAAFRLP